MGANTSAGVRDRWRHVITGNIVDMRRERHSSDRRCSARALREPPSSRFVSRRRLLTSRRRQQNDDNYHAWRQHEAIARISRRNGEILASLAGDGRWHRYSAKPPNAGAGDNLSTAGICCSRNEIAMLRRMTIFFGRGSGRCRRLMARRRILDTSASEEVSDHRYRPCRRRQSGGFSKSRTRARARQRHGRVASAASSSAAWRRQLSQ